MIALRMMFVFLASSTFVEGQQRSERVSKFVEIYDPITGNHSSTADLAPSSDKGKGLIVQFKGTPCVCYQHSCKCCIGVRINPFNVDKIVCIVLNFNLQVMEFQVQLTVGDWTGLNFTVNALPLPPICTPPIVTPPLPLPLLFCLIIYDVILPVRTEFQSCFALLVRLAKIELVRVNIGCVRWGKNGVRLVGDLRLDSLVFVKPAKKIVK